MVCRVRCHDVRTLQPQTKRASTGHTAPPPPVVLVGWLSGHGKGYAMHDIAEGEDDLSRFFRPEPCTMWAREVRAVPRCMREMVVPWIKPRRAEMG